MRRHVMLIGVLATVGSLFTASVSSGSDVTNQQGADINGEAAGDNSGHSVAMSNDGNTIAIGAPYNDGNGDASGHVRVYTWNGSTWTQQGADINGEAAGDNSGHSVAMSNDGNTIAIGAPYNGGNGNLSGHVRVYTWNGSAWTQQGADIDGEAANDYSGSSVAMSNDGNTIAIGSYGNDGNGTNSGHVRVYTWNGSTWTQQGADIDGEAASDYSGYSVAMSNDGNTIAIGAPYNGGNGNASGHVRVYTWTAGAWTQQGADINGEAAMDRSGYSVAMSNDGNTIAIGSYGNDGNGNASGHVRVYTWTGSTWTQQGADIDGEAANDLSGWSVAMSNDGNTIAIGAPDNGGNGNASGHVRVYTWNGSAWTQQGADINGEAAYDRSGWSVAMSNDGNTIAIGAPYNGGNGDASGHVRVYATQVHEPEPIPMPVWRATLDPNGGSCIDTTTPRTTPWTMVFIGYHYLPNATDCTRDGYTFTGWAATTTPTTIVALPTLTDPRDGQRRMILFANADLIAIWNQNIDPIVDLNVFANFLCGPCTSAWLLFTMPATATDYTVTVNDTTTSCTQQGTFLELSLCELTSLTPGDYNITLIPTSGSDRGQETTTTLTLRN